MLLDGKKLLITGVLTDDSIAYAAAQVALENGAEILLTNVGKGRAPHREGGETAADDARRHADGRERPRRHQRRRRGADAAMGPGRRCPPRHRLRPAGRARWQLHDRAVGERRDRPPDVHLLAQGTDRRPARAAQGRRGRCGCVGREPDLRRTLCLADLRLDGRGQGRSRGDDPLSRARPRRRTGSGSTPSRPGRSGRWPARASPASTRSRAPGRSARRSTGRSPMRPRSARCAPSSCRTGHR